MPFSLAMYLYRIAQEKTQKQFEKNNIVLNFQDIENLKQVKDKEVVIKILKSAVVDHQPVEGRPYFLNPPITPLFYHDSFKRCVVAEILAELARGDHDRYKSDVCLILRELIDVKQAGIVQIFAWHALGQWVAGDKDVLITFDEDLKRGCRGSVGSILGLMLFCEALMNYGHRQKVAAFIDAHISMVRFSVQKALLHYFIHRYQLAVSFMPDKDQSFAFFSKVRDLKYFTSEQIEMGLQEIGLIPGSGRKGVWPGTQQADIVKRINKISVDYIPVIGYYLLEEW